MLIILLQKQLLLMMKIQSDFYDLELEQMGIGCEPIRLDSYTQKKMTFFFDPDGLPLPSRSDQSTTIPNRFLEIVRQVIATISRIEENADRKQLLREPLKG